MQFAPPGATGLAAIPADRADEHAIRCDRFGPDDAALVVPLLDGSTQNARDPDAVAARLQQVGPACLVEIGRAHRTAVLGAEVEHMAHLDAALNGQYSL